MVAKTLGPILVFLGVASAQVRVPQFVVDAPGTSNRRDTPEPIPVLTDSRPMRTGRLVQPTFSPVSLSYGPGWNLISLPFSASDPALDVLFPDAISAFEYAGAYRPVSQLAPCVGYWLNLAEGGSYVITGTVVDTCHKSLAAGWDLVGVPTSGVVVSDIQQSPLGNVISVFAFDSGYQLRAGQDVLGGGDGFWFNLADAGQLTLVGQVPGLVGNVAIVGTVAKENIADVELMGALDRVGYGDVGVLGTADSAANGSAQIVGTLDQTGHGQVLVIGTADSLRSGDVAVTGMSDLTGFSPVGTVGSLDPRVSRSVEVTGTMDLVGFGKVAVAGDVDPARVGAVEVTAKLDRTGHGEVAVTGEIDTAGVAEVSIEGTIEQEETGDVEITGTVED